MDAIKKKLKYPNILFLFIYLFTTYQHLFLAQEGPCTIQSIPKPSLGACNNCLHTCPIGHWPLIGHRSTKFYLTGFLPPAKHGWLCGRYLHCAMQPYNKEQKIQCAADRRKGRFPECDWPNCVPALPFVFCKPWDDFTSATHCAKGKPFEAAPDLFATRGLISR